MTYLQAIILGLIQGITEFLPISSSAHLYLVPYVFGWDYQGLGFDVALHWGTLAAVLWVFWEDYLAALKNKMRMWFLVLATIPGALAGYFLEQQAESMFRTPLLSVFTLAGFAILLGVADKNYSRSRQPSPPGVSDEFRALNSTKALLLGVAQALAIVPGVSRSGATMTAGLFSGLSRTEAAKFSFLMAGPIIFGAGLVGVTTGVEITRELVLGFAASAISSFLAIKFLLRFLTNHSFKVFVVYRLILAAFILVVIWTK